MKKIIFTILSLLLFSCKKEEKENFSAVTETTISGKTLFENEGKCASCHLPNKKIIGPSIIEIATIYKEKNANMVAFLKGETEPIVDPSQYAVMKTNLEITKKMSDQELKALEAYMYSFLKN